MEKKIKDYLYKLSAILKNDEFFKVKYLAKDILNTKRNKKENQS